METVDGPKTYKDNHLGGFEWCLKCFDQNAVYKNGEPVWKSTDELESWQLPPSDMIPAIDGYNQCIAGLNNLQKEMPEDELRRVLVIRTLSRDRSQPLIILAGALAYVVVVFLIVLIRRANASTTE